MKQNDDNITSIGSLLVKIGCVIGFFWVLVAFLSIISPLGGH